MDDRAARTTGALAGGLLAGLAISAMMLGKERVSGAPSDLIAWERNGADRLGLEPPSEGASAGGVEQAAVHAAHLALSAIGGLTYAAAFDEDAPPVASGLLYGAVFYLACHWIAGPALRLKPPEWRERPLVVAQHLIVHAVFGLSIAAAARAGARLNRKGLAASGFEAARASRSEDRADPLARARACSGS